MKKLLAIVLALAMVLSLSVFSFAAADAVSGTLADGTLISKPVSEVVKTGEEAQQYDSTKSFLASVESNPRAVSSGVVDFGGFFADIVEDTVDVPLPVVAKKGDKLTVTLSNGSTSVTQCNEDGVVVVPFPKDAAGIGFCISKVKTANNWALPAPLSGGDEGKAGSPSYPVVTERRDGEGRVVYERIDWDEDSYAEYNYVYSEDTVSETYTIEDTDWSGRRFTETGSNTYPAEGGRPISSSSRCEYEDGSVETSNTTTTKENDKSTVVTEYSAVNADGSSMQDKSTYVYEDGNSFPTSSAYEWTRKDSDNNVVSEGNVELDENYEPVSGSETEYHYKDGEYTGKTVTEYKDGMSRTSEYDADNNLINGSSWTPYEY